MKYFEDREKRNYTLKKKNIKGRIRCRLCGKYFYQITGSHVMNFHGITMDEYKEKFPLAKTVSKATQELRALNNEVIHREVEVYIPLWKRREERFK